MTKKSCFEHTSYRKYLEDRLPTSGEERGLRSKLAKALGVQTAFVSRVMHEDAHFSLEHAVVLNRFLGHTEAESEYFLLLLQRERAGSAELRDYFQKRMEEILRQRQIIAERIKIKTTFSGEDQLTYYSAWYYSAVHVMLLVPKWQTPNAIAKHLQLPLPLLEMILEFLVRTGMAKEGHGCYQSGQTRAHLDRSSPTILRHHANWRMRSLQAMERLSSEDLFYSGPVCLSEADAKRLKEMLLQFIEESEKIIAPSPEETVFCMGIDFFRV